MELRGLTKEMRGLAGRLESLWGHAGLRLVDKSEDLRTLADLGRPSTNIGKGLWGQGLMGMYTEQKRHVHFVIATLQSYGGRVQATSRQADVSC